MGWYLRGIGEHGLEHCHLVFGGQTNCLRHRGGGGIHRRQ